MGVYAAANGLTLAAACSLAAVISRAAGMDDEEEIKRYRERELRAIDLARMHELEKKARLYGSQAEPAVLIELKNLYDRYPQIQQTTERVIAHPRQELLDELTVDFLMSSVAAALRRVSELEQLTNRNTSRRDMLLAIIAMLLIVVIVLVR